MIYVKSFLAGLVAMILSAVLIFVAFITIPRRPTSELATGFAGWSVGPLPMWLALLGFVLGFWWQFRRSSRRVAQR